MNLARAECRKLVRTYKLIPLMIFVLLTKILFLATEDTANDAYLIERQADFRPIVNEYAGRLTDKKSEKIENTFRDVSNVEITTKQIRQDYEQGKITKEAYYESLGELNRLISVRDLFLIFYRQYSYAKENPDQRYLLDRIGWNALISTPRFDWGCVLLIAIVSVAIFASEYEAEMVPILITTRRGNRALVSAKIKVVLILTGLIAVLTIAIETGFIFFRYTLPNPTFPIQSLPFFENCAFSLRLIDAFLLITALRITGFILFACASMLAGVLFRSSVFGAFVSLGYIVFPYALSLPAEVVNVLPTPLRFFQPQFILTGGAPFAAAEAAQPGIGVDPSSFFTGFGLSWVCALSLMIALIYLRFTFKRKPFLRRKRRIHNTPRIAACLILVCLLAETRAVSGESVQKPQAVNLWDSYFAGYIEDRFITLYPFLMIESADGETMDRIIRDPFLSREDEEKQVQSIAAAHDKICYMLHSETAVRIDCVRIRDFTRKTIYYQPLKRTSGVIQQYFIEQYERSQARYFYIDNSNVLYLLESNDLFRVDSVWNRREKIIQNILSLNLSFSDDSIVYLTNLNELHTCNLTTKEDVKISGVHSDYFFQDGDNIYYRNIDEGRRIFKYSLSNRSCQEAAPFESYRFRLDGDDLFYLRTGADSGLYRYRLSTQRDELILDGNILDFYIADKQVYVLTLSGLTVDRIVKIDRQTLERKMIWTE